MRATQSGALSICLTRTPPICAASAANGSSRPIVEAEYHEHVVQPASSCQLARNLCTKYRLERTSDVTDAVNALPPTHDAGRPAGDALPCGHRGQRPAGPTVDAALAIAQEPRWASEEAADAGGRRAARQAARVPAALTQTLRRQDRSQAERLRQMQIAGTATRRRADGPTRRPTAPGSQVGWSACSRPPEGR